MRPVSLGGNCEGGKVSTHSEIPLMCRDEGGCNLRNSAATDVWKQSRENSAQRLVLSSTSQPETCECMPTRVDGEWMLRLRLRGSDPRERTGVDYSEGAQRALIQHS